MVKLDFITQLLLWQTDQLRKIGREPEKDNENAEKPSPVINDYVSGYAEGTSKMQIRQQAYADVILELDRIRNSKN